MTTKTDATAKATEKEHKFDQIRCHSEKEIRTKQLQIA